ncbi:M48 family metallopeptidase [Microbulbifer sp. SA54]|uniref:M48 family metallopeptidase n=1 Tax=Microbulbifer sp. SA54 TaxID=3401577 RepID=UPI003AAEB215
MNFFEYQSKARRNTALLVTLFGTAVLGLIAITTLFTTAVLRLSRGESLTFDTGGLLIGWETVAGIATFISAVIAIATLYKRHQLADGGRAVAESLGGRKINTTPRDASEQRALNVVEEMAIASGTPVPDVYVLDDPSINAFAAGYQSTDAVIGLTRGSIEQLSRDELQGVIAHEFSHIFNGDMRLNIRLVGLLHGILIIGLAGQWLINGASWSGGRRRRGFPITALIGAGLIVIGYTGTLFGNLIKSAVSRQREYLADASAVQYTRNSHGLASALKKIAGYGAGTRISAGRAAEFSHMFFANGVGPSLAAMLSTHPPIRQRILRIDPAWRDERHSDPAAAAHMKTKLEAGATQDHRVISAHSQAVVTAGSVKCEALIDVIDNRIGNPTGSECALGQQLLAKTPSALRDAAHDPFSARAIVYALLMHPEQRATQMRLLEQIAHPAVMRALRQYLPAIEKMDEACRLPLLDLCVPALKELAPQQYQVFKRNLIKLLRSDARVDIWEWALYRVLIHALESRPDRQRLSSAPNATSDASRYLIAAMAHTSNGEYLPAKRAYDRGLKALELAITPLPAKSDILLQRLDKALAIAKTLAPLKKPVLLKAMAITLAHDNDISPRALELLRAVADSLDCPMPPMIPPGLGHRQTTGEMALNL